MKSLSGQKRIINCSLDYFCSAKTNTNGHADAAFERHDGMASLKQHDALALLLAKAHAARDLKHILAVAQIERDLGVAVCFDGIAELGWLLVDHDHCFAKFSDLPEARFHDGFSTLSLLLLLREDEPPRVCRRLQLLRDWSHDESQDIPEVFRRSA